MIWDNPKPSIDRVYTYHLFQGDAVNNTQEVREREGEGERERERERERGRGRREGEGEGGEREREREREKAALKIVAMCVVKVCNH